MPLLTPLLSLPFPLLPPAVTQCRLSAQSSSFSIITSRVWNTPHDNTNFHFADESLLTHSKPSSAEQSTFVDAGRVWWISCTTWIWSRARVWKIWSNFFCCCDDRMHKGLHNVCMGWQSVISCDTWRVSQVEPKVCHCYCSFALETHTLILKQQTKTPLLCCCVCKRWQKTIPAAASAAFEPHKKQLTCVSSCVCAFCPQYGLRIIKYAHQGAKTKYYISPACCSTIPTLDVSVPSGRCCDDSSGRLYMNWITKISPMPGCQKQTVFVTVNNNVRWDMLTQEALYVFNRWI